MPFSIPDWVLGMGLDSRQLAVISSLLDATPEIRTPTMLSLELTPEPAVARSMRLLDAYTCGYTPTPGPIRIQIA